MHLRIDAVSVSFPDRRVLTDVSFVVSSGDRVGLIGENGSGKSTLLRVAAGLLSPDAGTARVVGGQDGTSAVGLLHQEAPFAPSMTVDEAIETAVAPIRAAVAAVDHSAQALAEVPQDSEVERAYAHALDVAERLDAWSVDARISTMLVGLGLASVPGERRTGELSGGQRSRLSLAWLLLRDPDVLLLDEPTNHLDDAATEHLRRVLLGRRGPVLLASHDRAFLDEVVTSLVDLDPAPIPHRLADEVREDGPGSGIGVTRFSGTYSDYLVSRAEARLRWERRYRDEQDELRRLRAGVQDGQQVGHANWKPRTESRIAKKFYADRNAKVVARRVNDARARLETLEKEQIRRPPEELAFAGLTASGVLSATSPEDDGPLLTASDVHLPGRLAPVSLALGAGDKLLVTGANGAGKSTLLRLISGRLAPASGTLNLFSGSRVGLLGQDVTIALSREDGSERTVAEAYREAVGAERAERTPLSTFGLLSGRDEHRPVGALSLGQRRRLELAILLADPPELLLLDEPTNHLSLPLVTALERAIGEYPGTVVIASHDRWIRERWAGARLDLEAESTG
ncbi:ABC-F family ATP-binding cassette domain-containing protein [Nocardiopsis alba]|uniref:ABC-F family ATP-binding cassette domain-containing protein n=1 Tax=Nocardiopsis alba TaxID=53437 RepID=UPI00366EC57E